ncbi:MAG: class I SAM-dependent methyltransferase [Candidatus Pacebacteria bacterium]|nr:class I SAM-dependent methyltransferase [Candidatus Paceibacterota bacterium]
MPFSKPASIIKYLGLIEGMKVADFGSGLGAYTKEASFRVGLTGRVYAIEIQREIRDRLKKEIKEAGIVNTEVILGNIEKPGGTELGDRVIDVVILANILFLVPDKVSLVREVVRVLKPGGKVLVVDWTDSFGSIGPIPAMVIQSSEAEKLFIGHGFSLVEEIPESGEHHYGMIFVRA